MTVEEKVTVEENVTVEEKVTVEEAMSWKSQMNEHQRRFAGSWVDLMMTIQSEMTMVLSQVCCRLAVNWSQSVTLHS